MTGACGGSTSTDQDSAADPTTASSAAPAATTAAAATTTTEPPDTNITSEDGDVTLRIPFGAAADTSNIAIRVLPVDEYPPVLAGAAQNPGTVLYGLEPAGTTFSEPVRITRRIPVENFANVPANGVPLIALLVTSDNGESFEQLPGAQVIRDGDDFLVRGEISHFSTLVSIYELEYAVIDTYQLGDDLNTEVGTPIITDVSFFADDGTPLMRPKGITPSGWTRADEITFDIKGSSLGVVCGDLGTFKVGLRYDVTLPVGDDAATGAPGFRTSPVLTGSNEPVGFRYKISLPVNCFDPDTAVTGRSASGTVGTDHPGGQAIVPNGDFKGGASAKWGSFTLAPWVTWEQPKVGLINDSNGNGMVDATDTLHPATLATEENGGFGFVAPLYSYGDYFLYMFDGASFDGTTTDATTVREGLLGYQTMFSGSGRFETSMGLLGIDGVPFVDRVGSGESSQDFEGELLIFISPSILDF